MRPYRYATLEALEAMGADHVKRLHDLSLRQLSAIGTNSRKQLRLINRELRRRKRVGPE